MAKLSPLFNEAQFINGIPAVGAQLFTYSAGSTTPLPTFTDSSGNTAQSNPIILDARGEPSSPIWLTEGLAYKFVFTSSTDTDPPTSPIRTVDNVTGVGDNTVTFSQWQDTGVSPVYVDPTTFSVSGDQTSIFSVGRRIKAFVTSGTVYGYITSSVFTTNTTVQVDLDSGALDSGLSSVQLGLLTPDNSSIPLLTDDYPIASGSLDKTKKLRLELDGLTTSSKRVWTVQDKDITVAGIDDVSGGANFGSKLQPISASVALNALTANLLPTTLDFRNPVATNGTPNTLAIPSQLSITVPTGATLGTVNAIKARLALLVAYNGGTPVLCIANTRATSLDETGLISPTIISGASNSNSTIYSATAVSANSPYRNVGFIDITETTAGTWASGPLLVQGAGENATSTINIGLSKFSETAQQTITAAGALTIAHGLGTDVKFINAYIVCTVAEFNWSVGDIVNVGWFAIGSGTAATAQGFVWYSDSSNINILFGSAAGASNFQIPDKTTRALVNITNTSWRIVFRLWG